MNFYVIPLFVLYVVGAATPFLVSVLSPKVIFKVKGSFQGHNS